MVHDDIDLVKRSLRGERDAFEALVRKYQDAVYGLAFHLTGDFTDAQDIAQQVFVTAYLKLPQLKDPGKFVRWINKITVNECVSLLRRRQRISQLQERAEYLGRPVPTPHQECEERELDAAVRRAMESLSEKNRLAMTLYYIDGLSQREVASFLEISTSAVENRISRARKQLKEEMMRLVEDTFKDSKLPDDFTKRIRESLEKAQEARKRGDSGEVLACSDEALDALGKLPENPQARELRKEALWLKGDAVWFPLGAKETLRYHEQALELERKEEDKLAYARSLLRLSYDYSNADQKEKATEYRQKALEIYEEIGDLAGQAEIWMWEAGAVLFTEPVEALARFQEAFDLYSQEEKGRGEDYESVCRSAVALIKEVGTSPGIDQTINCDAVSEVLERTSDKLNHISEPGFGRCHMRTDYRWEEAFGVGLIISLQEGGRLLDYDLGVSDNWTMEVFSYTFRPLKATRTIESDSDTVSVIAGEFGNCLRLKTVITPSPDDDGPQRQRELNKIYCGTKEAWFAPGVGPVKFTFDRADGVHAHIELTEYHVEDGGDDYFPLSVGNRWVYWWPGLDERYVAKACYEVAFRKHSRYYIDHYSYAYFSGSKEEYDALGEQGYEGKET